MNLCLEKWSFEDCLSAKVRSPLLDTTVSYKGVIYLLFPYDSWDIWCHSGFGPQLDYRISPTPVNLS